MPDLPRIISSPATSIPTSSARLDADMNSALQSGQRSVVPPPPNGILQRFPEVVFPQRPELLTAADEPYMPKPGEKRHYTASQILHTMKGWALPYLRSRITPGEFHPLIAYLFNEWKCNLDCQYCWANDNSVAGMTEDVAKRSIDWLHSTTCRVLALMGGEVLLRPEFAHKIVYYAAKRGFWVYVPTNGRLMKPDLIDRLADAGMSTVNLAVDAWDVKPGLAQGDGSHPPVFRLPGAQAVQVRILRLPQHQYLPQQPGRRPPADPAGPRQRHRHRLPHLRNADDGPGKLPPHGEQSRVHPR